MCPAEALKGEEALHEGTAGMVGDEQVRPRYSAPTELSRLSSFVQVYSVAVLGCQDCSEY